MTKFCLGTLTRLFLFCLCLEITETADPYVTPWRIYISKRIGKFLENAGTDNNFHSIWLGFYLDLLNHQLLFHKISAKMKLFHILEQNKAKQNTPIIAQLSPPRDVTKERPIQRPYSATNYLKFSYFSQNYGISCSTTKQLLLTWITIKHL